MVRYTVTLQHTAATVRRLSKVQYAVTARAGKLVCLATAAVCLLLGTRLVGNIAEPFNYIFSLYGCAVLVFQNVPADWRAGKVISQIERAGGHYPCTVFHLEEDCLEVTAKVKVPKPERYPYVSCRRLLEENGDLYYFVNDQAAFLFPADGIPEGQEKELREFLSEKTGLEILPVPHWWNLSLKSLLKLGKNRKK